MKVIAKEDGKLATDPRTMVSFTKGEELAIGIKGLKGVNIERLLELDLVELVEVKAEIEVVIEPVEVYDFESFTDKDELEVFARDVYEVELDKRKSLKKMIAKLKETIERKV